MSDEVKTKLDSISAKLLLQETFETLYGIFDHENHSNANPLALVAMHQKEDVHEYSELYRTINRYKIHQIHEQWGLSLTEFLNLPREIVRLIFRISTATAASSQKPVEDALRELERAKREAR